MHTPPTYLVQLSLITAVLVHRARSFLGLVVHVHEMMKILFIDDCSQETYLANVLIRCSIPPQVMYTYSLSK